MFLRKFAAFSAALGMFLTAGVAWAVPPSTTPPNFVATGVNKAAQPISVNIPEHAVELAPGVFELGAAADKDGRVVQGIAFVHYKKDFSHRTQHVGGGKNKNGQTCYAFLAKGAKWKVPESYIVDPTPSTTTQQVAPALVRSLLGGALGAWDIQVSANIFGTEDTLGTVDREKIGTLNGQNEFMFGDIDSPGAIAVTIVWGIFYGPPSGRELVEWDMVFDDFDFGWSAEADGVPDKMDFLNIAAHEVGHAAGMGHPSDSCAEETMYRFAGYAETKKRDLNAGDIAGIRALY